MRGITVRFSALVLSALAGLSACGGDDDDNSIDAGDNTADAAPADASETDAGVVTTRHGTIAITETAITNPLPPKSPITGFQGAAVSMVYIDDQRVDVQPVEGFNVNPPIGTCLIFRYDLKAGDENPPQVDEGDLTVNGTANGTFNCRFDMGAREYRCQPAEKGIRGGELGNARDGSVSNTGRFILANAGFSEEMRGMDVVLTGFGKPDGRYPIVDVENDETLLLEGVEVSATGGPEATFTTFVGAGPTPLTKEALGFDFLDDGTNPITITKTAGDVAPEFSVNTFAPGQGWAFAAGSDLPHLFPTTQPTEVRYFCEEPACGEAPDTADTTLRVMTVSGVTTDVLPQDDPFGIGMEPPLNSYATFQCSGQLGADEVTISAEAVAEILAASPARIRVSVGRFYAALQNVAGKSDTTVLIGHSYTGFTTVPPPPTTASAGSTK